MKIIGGPPDLFKKKIVLNLQARPLFVYKTDFKIKDDFLNSFISKTTFHDDENKIK